MQTQDSIPASMSKLAEVVEEESSAETVAELQARVRELETEQRLMQHELDSLSQEAQRTDNHLRCCLLPVLWLQRQALRSCCRTANHLLMSLRQARLQLLDWQGGVQVSVPFNVVHGLCHCNRSCLSLP